MSLGAELIMRAIHDTMGDTVLLSEFGDGSPLLDASARAPVRLAHMPIGGVIRRNGLATFAPPLDISQRSEDCARLAQNLPVILDALVDDARRLIASAESLGAASLTALRLRGGEVPQTELQQIYQSPSGDDRVYLRREAFTDQLQVLATTLQAAQIDEFDALTNAIVGGDVITSLRHGARRSDAIFDPASLLDQADPHQVAAALGDGRAIMARDSGCSLFIPQLSATPMPAQITISGLEDGARAPIIAIPNAPAWTVELQQADDALTVIVTPDPNSAPIISLFVEIQAPDSPNAQITEVASAIARTRGDWEIWDEAQQQLELEESW